VHVGAGTQFFRRSVPIFFRRSLRATSLLPKLIRAGRDFGVSKRGNAMPNRSACWRIVTTVVLRSLARLFVSSEVLLLALLLGNTMRVRGAVL
jgi:hypothetical protein